MSLTVGTTLQNGNFVIEAILHQSDFGVTYQAAHPSINHPIILQSFNEVLRQRSDFDPLRQKFLQEVLLFSKQPSDTVQIIDCFEENGMPFVVLEVDSNQSIPPLSDWLEIPVEAPSQDATQPTTEASALAVALAAAFPEPPPKDLPKAAVIAAPIASAAVAETRTAEIAIANAEELAPVLAAPAAALSPSLKSFPLPDHATNVSRNGVTVLFSAQKPKNWMPLALMMTTLIAGFSGAGLGLALRFKPTPQADNTRELSSGWFGREQSFPPQQEWPITETPNLYPSSSVFEQPLYQPNSPVPESGIPRVQPPTEYIPSTEYIPPAQIVPPDYQPAPPGIADYPPTIPAPPPSVEPAAPAAPAADPPIPEAIQPVIPLPQPITPQVPPETSPETNKQPTSSSKNVPAD